MMKRILLVFLIYYTFTKGDVKVLDFSGEWLKQVEVETDKSKYYGNPGSAVLKDGLTVFVGYPDGPTRPGTIMRKSLNGGKEWSPRLNVPEGFSGDHYQPSLHAISDSKGRERIYVIVGKPMLKAAYSDDQGKTWVDFFELFPEKEYSAALPPVSMEPLLDDEGNEIPGHFITVFYERKLTESGTKYVLLKMVTDDGGLSWSEPVEISLPDASRDLELTCPCLIRSPEKNELICLCADHERKRNNLLLSSDDEGETWNFKGEVSQELTGVMHDLVYGPDGRIVSVFIKYGKDYADDPFPLDVVAWVGSYDDFISGGRGDYYLRIFENYGNTRNTGYSGTHTLNNGEILVVSSTLFRDGEKGKVLCFPFHLNDLEKAVDIQGPKSSDVFVSGEEGYEVYRIPALLSTFDGTCLAFAEGRSSMSDQAENDIVLKRSLDHGETWGSLSVVASKDSVSLNNPEVVQDRLNGRIFCMYQSYPFGNTETSVVPGYDGDNVCRGYVIFSDDDGVNWSAPKEITRSVKRPDYVTTIASGPGVGIQLSQGEYKDRLIFPFNQGPWGDWKVYAVYSDDHGETWNYGETALDSSSGTGNEVQMVELDDGSVLLNSRSYKGNKYRKVAISYDGGETWSGLISDSVLIEPECQGALFRYGFENEGKSRVIFSNPYSDKDRKNGVVLLSYDNCETWAYKKTVTEGFFAYSCLTRMKNDDIGLLYESDDYGKIVFKSMSLSWLTNGKDKGGVTNIDEATMGRRGENGELNAEIYPNPFKDWLRVKFYLDAPASVKFKMYDVLGREVDNKKKRFHDKGWNEIYWKRKKRRMSNGLYLIKIEIGKKAFVGKMIKIN